MELNTLQTILLKAEREAEKMEFDLRVHLALVQKLRETVTECVSNEDNSLADLAIAVLERAGRPMRVREIAMELEKMGVETSSPRGLRPMIVSAITRRKDRVGRRGHGLYALNTHKPECTEKELAMAS
ncbi:MAG TPA: hypothetical protein PK400_07375 [Phycisphaerales bacterium]|nr:hypothetical protein [Phycisphaerales bacterium]HRQ76445.1 hypothetical protein [Phycisphaerales bacterium]